MRTSILAVALAYLLIPIADASAQFRKCLHGDNETRAERLRRESAVEFADRINDAQTNARRFGPRANRKYVPLDQLSNLPDTPDGFRVQLHTDGESYSFSIKDVRDPCRYAVFSDQSGDVYQGVPMPPRVGPKLLSKGK